MRRTSYFLSAVAALCLVLTPTLADARAGGSSSSGSRGSRTYTAPPSTATAPTAAQPMQRSVTPNTPAPSPGGAAPAMAAPARSGFMSGMMGGLIGAGIAGMLFGGGMFGGMSGAGGFLGFLLQIFLVVIAARLLFMLFRRFRPAQPAAAGGPSMFSRNDAVDGPARGPMPMGGMPSTGGRPPASSPITIVPADYQGFEQLLKNVQAAWSAQDPNALRAICTAEMFSYFGEQITELNRRNVTNKVTDITLLQGDLSEAWSEQGKEYATLAMKFSMLDVTTDATGRVVDGSPTEHVTATELWTFVRNQGGGNWILSAIQQTR